MHARLRRDGTVPHCRGRLRQIFDHAFNQIFTTTVRTATITAVVALTGASIVCADDDKIRTAPVDTEHLFGFVEGADIGGKGETEFVIDSSLRAGRSAGTFADTASELELKYTAFENFRISGAATLAWYDIARVPGIADVHHAAIQSLFVDARYRVLDRAQAPFGLTLSVSPHWGFVDETSGVRTQHFGAEIEMLADRELVPDRVAGAVNLLFANDRARLRAFDGIEHESLLGAGGALTAQILPGLWLGGEARYLRDYSGATLNIFSGQAVYGGPTVYMRLGPRAFVSAALAFQVWGSAAAAPGALDLVNFERIQAKLRVGFAF
jgi:hypothetical protein